jgi:hypothetical protein
MTGEEASGAVGLVILAGPSVVATMHLLPLIARGSAESVQNVSRQTGTLADESSRSPKSGAILAALAGPHNSLDAE